jgi:hypothetical protein
MKIFVPFIFFALFSAASFAQCTATISADGPTTICSGGHLALICNYSLANMGFPQYSWWKNGSPVAGGSYDNYYQPTTSGSYMCYASNGVCGAFSNAISVTVLPASNISLVGSSLVCPGDSLLINANAGAGSYQWKLNGANIPGATLNSYYAKTPGNYSCIESNLCLSNSIVISPLANCSGLIQSYPLDNNANDVSGNNFNGTLTYSFSPPVSVADRCGNANSAYNFSSQKCITIPTASINLNQFTYSAWCRPTSLPASGSGYCIMAVGGVYGYQGIFLGNSTVHGFGAVSISSANQFYGCYSGTLPVINQWYHLVMTRTNAVTNVYVNGALACSTSSGNSNAGYLGPAITAMIGARQTVGTTNFVGDIDDVRIYNKVLSLSEIQVLSGSCVTLNLRTFIEGYYLGNSVMAARVDPIANPSLSDSITVELHNAFMPYNLVESRTGVINVNGYSSLIFSAAQGNFYYIVVKHRTSLETWSKNPVLFNSSIVNFDFTSP